MSSGKPVLINVMGPCGCGKSTVIEGLHKALDIPFVDGDALHPPSNVEKMTKKIPLTDEDRIPWLQKIRQVAIEETTKQRQESSEPTNKLNRYGMVIGSSALRKYYRDLIRGEGQEGSNKDDILTLFVYLHSTPELLMKRMSERKNHFMGPQMVESQLATLERPNVEEETDCVWVDIDNKTPEQVLENTQTAIREYLSKH